MNKDKCLRCKGRRINPPVCECPLSIFAIFKLDYNDDVQTKNCIEFLLPDEILFNNVILNCLIPYDNLTCLVCKRGSYLFEGSCIKCPLV